MKMLSTALVVLGLGLASAYGARNSDNVMSRQEALGEARLLNEASARAHERLTAAKDAETGGETLDMLKADYAALSVRAGEAAHRAAGFDTVESPGRRFSDWFEDAGGPFGLGMILLIVGAVMARNEVRQAALGQASKQYKGARTPDAIDFGALLRALQADVAKAAAEAEAVEDPGDDDFKQLRYLVRNLQYDKVEPLVENRGRLEARFGLSGFAAIFGPLSAGERQLNRAWSALVDRHWPEASASLGRSAHYLSAALAEIDQRAASSE